VTIELKEMKKADSEEAAEGRKAAMLKRGLSD
jgi:arylsulfatase